MICPECKKKVGNSVNLNFIEKSNEITINQETINNAQNTAKTTPETTNNLKNKSDKVDEDDELNSITS